jgi:plasmid rolling circle replication initiator protein Rep
VCNQEEILLDESTNVKQNDRLTRRARAKYFSKALVLPLVDLNSPLKKAYWNTYHCCETLVQDGEEITGSYCKNRWCTVCNRIRTAVLINTYKPVLDSWEDKWFVTLTIPNVPAEELHSALEEMQAEFIRIRKTLGKRSLRGKGDKFIGFRKLECTYNPDRDDYHPHYHVIVKGENMARALLDEWLRRFPDAKSIAQDIRPADDDSVMELFKYFTKLMVKVNNGKDRQVYIKQLDVIFQTIRGKRTFQNFGFTAPKEVEKPDEKAMEMADEIETEVMREVWQWHQEHHDWINTQTGEFLTGYVPAGKFRRLVESIGRPEAMQGVPDG